MSFLKKEDSRSLPQTGKIINSVHNKKWAWWLLPFTGLAALIWFLVRVIPKPSRAAYPCQRLAFPLASGFIVWSLVLALPRPSRFHKAKRHLLRARYVMAAICIVASVGFIWAAMSGTDQKYLMVPTTPNPANGPIGIGKGVHPGRVAWIYRPNAASWPGADGNTIRHTGIRTPAQSAGRHDMFSKAIRALTGKSTDYAAWDAIFRTSTSKSAREMLAIQRAKNRH